MPRSLTIDDALLRTYHRDGVVRLGQYLTDDELRDVHNALDRLAEEHEPSSHGRILNNVWLRDDTIRDLVSCHAMAALAGTLMEHPRVRLFQDNLVWKVPGSARIEWHQDYSYQPLDGPRGVTLWLCLDHTTERSGCLHYVPRTHLQGERTASDFFAGTGQPKRTDLPDLDWRSRLDDVVALRTHPGELLAHHPLVWHMSPSNTSERQRRAISVNWVPEDMRWKPSQAPHPFNYELGLRDGEHIQGERFPSFVVSKEAREDPSQRQ